MSCFAQLLLPLLPKPLPESCAVAMADASHPDYVIAILNTQVGHDIFQSRVVLIAPNRHGDDVVMLRRSFDIIQIRKLPSYGCWDRNGSKASIAVDICI